METIGLKKLGLSELSHGEASRANGGWWQAALVALVISAINNWGDIRDGLADGYNGTPRH